MEVLDEIHPPKNITVSINNSGLFSTLDHASEGGVLITFLVQPLDHHPVLTLSASPGPAVQL